MDDEGVSDHRPAESSGSRSRELLTVGAHESVALPEPDRCFGRMHLRGDLRDEISMRPARRQRSLVERVVAHEGAPRRTVSPKLQAGDSGRTPLAFGFIIDG